MTTPTHAPLTKIAAACAVQYMHQGITIVLMPHSPEMIGRRDGKVKRSNKVTAVPNNQPEGKKKKWELNKKLFYSMTLLCRNAPPHSYKNAKIFSCLINFSVGLFKGYHLNVCCRKFVKKYTNIRFMN